MDRTHRILWKDGVTLRDVSIAATDWRGDAFTFAYTAGDYLYIGCELPFGYKYFDVSVVNAIAATPTVELWSGDTWLPAKDLIDETAVSGVSLGRAGIISWSQDIDNMQWSPQRKSSEVTGLAATEIYNLFWIRVSWSATLTIGTELEYIGFRFSDDEALTSFYPDLSNTDLKTAFAAGKTTWREQHLLAAEAVVRDLKRRKILWRSEQIFEPNLFQEAACHKCAEVVYGGLGQAYAAVRTQAAERYKDAINIAMFEADANESGNLDPDEKRASTSYLTR